MTVPGWSSSSLATDTPIKSEKQLPQCHEAVTRLPDFSFSAEAAGSYRHFQSKSSFVVVTEVCRIEL